MSSNLFPLVSFDSIDNDVADACMVEWSHWLGPCKRPFGIQSFGLHFAAELVAVCMSASTVVDRCAGYDRTDVIELARQCAHPDHRDMNRVAIRLWRKVAARCWGYWPARAYVTYANSIRHTGDLYRFDGWKRFGDAKGGKKSNYGRPKTIDPKSIWVYPLDTSAPVTPLGPERPTRKMRQPLTDRGAELFNGR